MIDFAAWEAQPGSQRVFLTSPALETIYDGTRGPGKTVALLADFASEVGQGYGRYWRGILFRRTYKELSDVIEKSIRLFSACFPDAKYNASDHIWKFATGEELLLRYMASPKDYWNYHGHEYPWIGWDELTNWPNMQCYEAMNTCCRSTHPGVPRRIRATTNPFGVGHHVVKAYVIDPAPAGKIIRLKGGITRVRVRGHWSENKALIKADPRYPHILAADTDPHRRKAWLKGGWDIVAGGFFDDLWNADVHVMQPFRIPKAWYVDRAFDWGSAKPFSVGYYAESDGTPCELADGRMYKFPPGTVFRIAEIYGWSGKPNEGVHWTNRQIAEAVLAADKTIQDKYGVTVYGGPADPTITHDATTGDSIAKQMKERGVDWIDADNHRVNGWEKCRSMLMASHDFKDAKKSAMEEAGFFCWNTCPQFIRTVPALQRDLIKINDVNTENEDHIGDEWRYRLNTVRGKWGRVRVRF